MNIHSAIIISMVAGLSAGCATSNDVFSDIGTHMASPSSISIDVANNRLYLVNSNSNVLYDSKEGSFQVYDISNPLAPVLVDTEQTLSFSGETYVDTVAKFAYIPNRYTSSSSETSVRLYKFNIDEASANFLTYTESTLGRGAFAIYCCYPANRAWVTTDFNELQYMDLTGDLTPSSVALNVPLNNGGAVTNAAVDFIAVSNNQMFLSYDYGGIFIVNMDNAGAAGVNPVDYFIGDIQITQGIAVNGTNLYVAGQGTIGDTYTQFLMILDVSSLTPVTTTGVTAYIDKDDLSPVVISVGNNPQEVLLTTDYAFVTNLNDNTVSVIRLADNTVAQTISVGEQPFSLALYTATDGTEIYVYVGNIYSNTVSIIDIATLAVVATF